MFKKCHTIPLRQYMFKSWLLCFYFVCICDLLCIRNILAGKVGWSIVYNTWYFSHLEVTLNIWWFLPTKLGATLNTLQDKLRHQINSYIKMFLFILLIVKQHKNKMLKHNSSFFLKMKAIMSQT